ncbi:MAG TPA: protein kinase [Bryobacteraceae bacterium]|jgi:serine/threonine protein kinase|nr:protein kinase [Bryobacteraceae bacterium]
MKAEVERLFHELVDLAPQARSRYFAEHPVDEATRQEVEALLAFDPGASSFLTRDISLAASRSLPELEGKGCLCGPYRLLDLIGRGGMGAVYRAERTDGEGTRPLAIKLLPLGSGDLQRDRFLQERRILASLTHPNIARMIDAGHLDNGQPYLVMEYIDGQPIDVFAAGFTIRQTVTLFLKVCASVAHLHRNVVVHRDLKPDNILVTAEGEPMLLDFGIAKMLDLATDPTLTYQRMLTPKYASPEQVTGGRISTAVDIYSLGVVLYQLLTGKPVHEFDDPSPEGIAHVIATCDAIRPSRWAPELKGDLESILLKALRRDQHERYATVEQFADDLRAYLESRPVRARSADWWYRSRKFVRRYWIPVSAAATVIAGLTAGLYYADRQRSAAERQVTHLRSLSGQLLSLESQLNLPGAGTDLNLHRQLVAISIQFLQNAWPANVRDRKLMLSLGDAYLRIARIQGVPEWNQQGEYVEAERSLNRVSELANTALAAEPSNRQALWLLANAAHDRAVIAYSERRPQDVAAYSPKVVDGFERLAKLGHLTRREINGGTYIYGDLAEVHIGLHRFADAARYARLAIEYSRDTPTVPGPRAQAFNMLAGALTYQGDLPGALAAVREARSLWEQLRHDEGDTKYTRLILYQTRCREALLLGEDNNVNLNRPREAEALFREAFAAPEELVRKDRNEYEERLAMSLSGHYLGDLLRHTDPRKALGVYDYALTVIREVPNDADARRAEALLLAGSSYAARWLHRERDAKDRIDAAFRLLKATGDYPAAAVSAGSEANTALLALADHYAETGQAAQAIEVYEKLGGYLESCSSCANDLPAALSLSQVDSALAATLRRTGSSAKAAGVEAGRRELWRVWDAKLPNNAFIRRQKAAAESPAR